MSTNPLQNLLLPITTSVVILLAINPLVASPKGAEMAPTRKPRLAAGELEMLEMLWRAGSVTILEAQQALGQSIGYTTVQTRLNRLVAKKLAKKSAVRPAKYSAAITPGEVRGRDLDLLVHRVSEGRVTPLVAHLLDQHDVSAAELKGLKQLVADAERKAREREQGGRDR